MSLKFLNIRGTRCPMCIVMVSRAVNAMSPGERLEVEADDPAFSPDLQAWTRKTGNALVTLEPGAITRATIEKR